MGKKGEIVKALNKTYYAIARQYGEEWLEEGKWFPVARLCGALQALAEHRENDAKKEIAKALKYFGRYDFHQKAAN